ncbi:hypothetical protein [Saccharibacter sp. 17.LH.SD]|uniref:NADH-quinone oxidoreductase subunit D-related protein n=1 Tax=Saccharibacter sp. 17.LH.SD TaxID=2689393 RepID=UPI001925FADF|nr:hypothetical protein [Saccharibacter sp. 17.LH.SD]
MSLLSAIMQHGERVGLSHYRVDNQIWQGVLQHADKTVSLIASWADEDYATMLLLEDELPFLLSVPVEKRRYYAPSMRFLAAQWGERMARDLWGVEPLFALDDRSALDNGSWTLTWPMAREPIPVQGKVHDEREEGYELKAACLAVPGLLDLTYNVSKGLITKLDVHIASGHRGILSQVKGLSPQEALPLISRVSAGGFVAHPLAFVRAVEQAQAKVPLPQERDIRFILLEVERISLHLFDIGLVARCVKADLLATHCDHAREVLAQLCSQYGVSRRLTDTVRFWDEGSKVSEIVPFAQAVTETMQPLLPRLTGLNRLFSSRMEGIAILSPEHVWGYAIGGVTGRASGRYIDMRSMDVGMRLDALRASGRHEGCALARNGQRLLEIRDSLYLIQRIIASLGIEDEAQTIPMTGEGLGVAEGARGDIWYWVKLLHGKIENLQVRDPTQPVLCVLEGIMRGHQPDDIPLALASLGISPAGVVL